MANVFPHGKQPFEQFSFDFNYALKPRILCQRHCDLVFFRIFSWLFDNFAFYIVNAPNIVRSARLNSSHTLFCSYPVDPGSAVYYGIVSDTVENEAQAFNLSRRLLHIFQMRVGPNLWNDGVIGYQILPLVEQGRLMAGLFDIVCQNFESNVDSILGLHEDVNVRKVEPTALEKIFNPWKEFVDSLVKPKLAAQAPSAPPRTNWAGRSQEKESEDLTNSPRCLLWYKSSQKIVLLASNCRALLDEDCLLLKDHIPFLLQPPIPPQASAVSQAASVDAASSVLIEGTSDGVQEFLGSSISSVLDVAESSRVGGSASASGLDQLSSFFPDIVFLGQIDDRSGSFLPGKQKFLLYQNIFFEDKDGVLVLQSLFPHVPPDTTLALPSNSDNEKLLSESVESFKDKLTKSFASNPWSIMVHHNMDTFIMDFPGLVQFLCINRWGGQLAGCAQRYVAKTCIDRRSQNKLFSPGPHGHCSAKKMEDEMRQCVLWGLLQRQADMFTSVATMNGKQYAYLLWVEDSSGIEISVILLISRFPPASVALLLHLALCVA